jgi:formylglycine-generating enzyme required for sulfatase activity
LHLKPRYGKVPALIHRHWRLGMVRAFLIVFSAMMLLAGIGRAAFAEKRVALVIGNSNYRLAPLANPRNDADDLAAALKRLQFEVTEKKDLAVRDFDLALDGFIPTAQNADVALFFFSGHGVQIDKRGYLAPTDTKAETESSALRELVAIQEVVSRIENAAKVSVIILDACRDSPLQERLRRIAIEKNKALVPPKGLPPMSVVGSNTLIVYATVPGETASDGVGRNSPFTASLLKNIETPGLEIELVFKRVTADVLSATGGKQQPERLSRLQHELMLSPQAQETVTATSKSNAGASAPMSEAAQAWSEIKDSKNPAVFKAFREQFGKASPVYDLLAADKEAELTRAAERPKDTQTAFAVPQKPAPVHTPSEPACDGLLVSVAMGKSPCIKPGSGEVFKDCPACPEMVVVPQGSFIMGSPESEQGRSSLHDEGPQHEVTIAKPFAVGRFPVTFAEWDACLANGGCGRYKPSDEGWGRAGRPVINVSWNDAMSYVGWLSKKTGRTYRLLAEAEREYVTRAGTQTAYWWGDTISKDKANYYGSKTVPVKSFDPNPWGLYQVHGNVYDWVEDCRHDDYSGAPGDGSAWTTGECTRRVLRGGSWHGDPQYLRAAYRGDWGGLPDARGDTAGFRVARTLNP